jgi:phenylacetate-CoA ligase
MNQSIAKYLFYYPSLVLRRQNVPKYLKAFRKSQWLSRDQIEKIQLEKLIGILEYAKARIPYYKVGLRDIAPRTLKSLYELESIPILTKDAIKEHFQQMHITDCKYYEKTTGGSTGNPVTVCKNAAALAQEDAAYWRGYEWAGITVCSPQGRFWGVPHKSRARKIAYLKDIALNRLRCSAFSFDQESLDLFIIKLDRFKPTYLYGYVSMLEYFANHLSMRQTKLDTKLIAAVATSEILSGYHRKLFEKAFGCKVFEEYGCGEVGTIAHECEFGSLHINAENLIVEIVREGKAVPIGEQGEVVVTDLNNIAMPLIRYNLGDLSSLKKTTCGCGRGLPVLGPVVGRAYDTILNREGKAFHGEFFLYIFEELQDKGIRVGGFQVIQEDYDNLTIKVVAEDDEKVFLERFIDERLQREYGPYVRTSYQYVARIEREESGKLRLIRASLAKER